MKKYILKSGLMTFETEANSVKEAKKKVNDHLIKMFIVNRSYPWTFKVTEQKPKKKET